jgi:hypothetical protein
MRALTQLDISENTLGAEGGKNLAEALNGNQVMTSLSVASNYLAKSRPSEQDVTDMSGIIALVNTIKDMRALTNLHVGKNNIPEKEMKEIMRKTSLCAWTA